MTHSLQHLLAASALITTLERICSSGVLSERDECDARMVVARACKAFDLPSIAERPSAEIIQIGDHDPEYRRKLQAVAQEMER